MMRIYRDHYLCASVECDVERGRQMGFKTFFEHLIIPKKHAVRDKRGLPRCPVCHNLLRTKHVNRGVKKAR
ncbi:MAG: hypothetical protein QW491_09430 [Thermoproteota archaeon]